MSLEDDTHTRSAANGDTGGDLVASLCHHRGRKSGDTDLPGPGLIHVGCVTTCRHLANVNANINPVG
ncbi:MAG: hypothetical protein GY845_02485 [Planctomycetes bacterium]|nr:hypothetical protein [Planctomycetota bacterium]